MGGVKLLRSQKGFTIVETMIVLAVAGMILLLVFLALPALERSSRNNQRKEDVQAVLQVISHCELNNTGNLQPCMNNLQSYIQGKISFYDPSKVTFQGCPVVHGPCPTDIVSSVPAETNQDKVDIYYYAKCTADGSATATNAGASYNDLVALYALETGGSSAAAQCQQF